MKLDLTKIIQAVIVSLIVGSFFGVYKWAMELETRVTRNEIYIDQLWKEKK